ncbi:MAG: DUF542 domain-containing protein [Phycisphaeraceae bacterium]|nr:DUF542 domain-containing protein [Phycisphaeraceae bacterium]
MTELNADCTIAGIVSMAPHAEAVLADLGIDNCCGAHATLREHCLRLRLNPDAVLGRLASCVTEGQAPLRGGHVHSLRAAAPRLLELAQRVAAAHAHRDARLGELLGVIESLAGGNDGGDAAADRTAALLARAGELTDHFRVPAQACGSWTQLVTLLGCLHEQAASATACASRA